MIVTRFQYPLELRLVKMLDKLIARCIQKNPKHDSVLLNEGAEGEGKTTISVAEAFYISEKTGRVFNETNIFFDLRKMIEFIQNTDNQIAIWDEPALEALTGDTSKRIIKDLTRLLMMCRKKRHFVIINMTYFNKFTDYIVWQRPLGMVHVYSRDETSPGRFVYLKKKGLEQLWQEWKHKHRRSYNKYYDRRIRGSFPDVLNIDYAHNVLSGFNYDAYNQAKDEAIQSIGKEKEKENIKLLTLQWKVGKYWQNLKLNRGLFAKQIKINERTLYRWLKIPPELQKLLENEENDT